VCLFLVTLPSVPWSLIIIWISLILD
jgi:hypothetical protein